MLNQDFQHVESAIQQMFLTAMRSQLTSCILLKGLCFVVFSTRLMEQTNQGRKGNLSSSQNITECLEHFKKFPILPDFFPAQKLCHCRDGWKYSTYLRIFCKDDILPFLLWYTCSVTRKYLQQGSNLWNYSRWTGTAEQQVGQPQLHSTGLGRHQGELSPRHLQGHLQCGGSETLLLPQPLIGRGGRGRGPPDQIRVCLHLHTYIHI